MLEFDFDNSLGFWVCGVAHLLRCDMNVELAREGITFRQWEVLVCTALGDTTQTEVAERLGIEAPTLVGVLERMERDGWLERYACPEDRRKKRIRVTRRAEEVWSRMVDCAHRVRARAREGMSDEDLATFKSLCDRILRNLSARKEPGSGGKSGADPVCEPNT